MNALETAVGGLVRAGVPGLFLVLDRDDRIVELSAPTRALLGDVLGRVLAELVVPSGSFSSPSTALGDEPLFTQMSLATSVGLPQTFHCGLVRAGDHVVIVGGIEPRDGELLRREMSVLNRDLAARTRDLQKTSAELARRGQLWSLFIATAAHDLRSPITVVGVHADLLRADLWEQCDADQRESLLAITEAAEHMAQVVASFMDLSVMQSGELRFDCSTFAPTDLARRAVAMVAPTARRGAVDLRVEAPGALPTIVVDGPRIQQALVSLLGNAIHGAPTGSEVVLALGADAEVVTFEIRGHGPGLADALADDPLAAFAGDGRKRDIVERSLSLGLAIARRLVAGHGGTIANATHPDRGATVTVTLPIDRE